MEKPITIMIKNMNMALRKFLILLLLIPEILFSQYDEGETNKNNYFRTHKSWMDFLPVDSVLKKTWNTKVNNQNCLPLIIGNLVFPSVVERIVIDATTGQTFEFGHPYARNLFSKEKLDSIICFPAKDSISLINIYTDEFVFSYHRHLSPGYEGPFFPKDNILYYGWNNKLYAYNFKYKKNLWETNIDKYTKNLYQTYKNYMIINDQANLLIINKNNGEIIQKFKNKRYNSDLLIGNELYYSDSYTFFKVDMETFKRDTIIKSKGYIQRTFTIEDDKIYFATEGQLNIYSISNKTLHKLPHKRICPFEFVKAGNYIISEDSDNPESDYTTIYDLKKGLPLYKYFLVKKEGDFYTLEETSFKFNPKLTDNGLLIGYTLHGNIQAFKLKKD